MPDSTPWYSALQQGAAVPAFTCYDFTTALAVVGAAEEAGRGAILLVAPKTAATPNGLRLIAALRGLADAAAVPIAVQLDHAADLQVIADAVSAGADSVLVDGSSLPYEDNIALVRGARAALAAQGRADVVIEAELGGLAGDEDRAFGSGAAGNVASDGRPASPTPPRWRTSWPAPGAQLLAVAVGNVHGKYKGEPPAALGRAAGHRSADPHPAGPARGLGHPAEELVKAAAMNVGKVNFNTELRTGVLAVLEERPPPTGPTARTSRHCSADWDDSAKDVRGHRPGHALRADTGRRPGAP